MKYHRRLTKFGQKRARAPFQLRAASRTPPQRSRRPRKATLPTESARAPSTGGPPRSSQARPANLLADRAAGSRRAHESARPVTPVARGGASRTGRKANPQACLRPAGQRQEALMRPLPAGGHATTYLCPRPRPRRVHFPLLPGPDGGERREVGVALPHLRQLLLLHLRFERETRVSSHDLTCARHESDRHQTIFV